MNVTLTFDTGDPTETQLLALVGLVADAPVTTVTSGPAPAQNDAQEIYDLLRAFEKSTAPITPDDDDDDPDDDEPTPDDFEPTPDYIIGNTADPLRPGDIPLWPYLGDMAPLKRLGYIAQVIDHGETFTMTYIDRKGNTTKRCIRPVRLVYGHLPHGALADAEASQTNANLRDRPGQWWVQAFCFKRYAYRTFRLDNILDIDPNQSAVHW